MTLLRRCWKISIWLLMNIRLCKNSFNEYFQTWGEVVLGPVVRALPILISLSALGTANILTYTCARYCMVSARYGYLPEIFSYIQKQRLTPLPGIMFQVSCQINLFIYFYFTY